MSKTFFLFGTEAVNVYDGITTNDDEELTGVDALLYADEHNISDYEKFVFIEGETSPTELLTQYDGYGDWITISEDEFNVL